MRSCIKASRSESFFFPTVFPFFLFFFFMFGVFFQLFSLFPLGGLVTIGFGSFKRRMI
ncbi:hypothetical protein FPQ18DRAFT_156702 [Pyronema domesticum]|nr:hypothetical protein FPQ18DRAFT_156702 [Pyronema domesticum]